MTMKLYASCRRFFFFVIYMKTDLCKSKI